MAIDVDKVIEELEVARRGLNVARNAAEDWRSGAIAGVVHTAGQKTALKSAFTAGLQAGKDGMAAVDAELAK